MSDDIQSVLACYPPDCRATNVTSLVGSGGFSGATIWKVSALRGPLALRCWPPEYPSPQRLAWIHAVAAHAAGNGFGLLPQPITSADGQTFVHRADRLWELAPWLPGRADYLRHPSNLRLENALRALARFHRSVESFEHVDTRRGPSPGAIDRRLRIAKLVARELTEIATALESCAATPACDWLSQRHPIVDAGRSWLALFPAAAAAAAPLLDEAARFHVAQQPCLRDVWSDHILFAGDEVTGIIDLGAMRVESVAADVARLLGSLVGDDAAGWQTGLAAYAAIRPLDEQELRLATALDCGNVLLSGINWLRWLLVERRQFDDLGAVVDRLRAGLVRLETLAHRARPAIFE